MSIVTEDGTGLSNAETYIDVSAADAYHTARGNSSWTSLSVPDKEAALRVATEYMVGSFRSRWKGFRATSSQRLDWPRQGVTMPDLPYGTVLASNYVPEDVKNACAELALRANTLGALAPDVERKVLSETVGPISVTYDKDSTQNTEYRQVTLILQPYMRASGINTPVRRV